MHADPKAASKAKGARVASVRVAAKMVRKARRIMGDPRPAG